MNVMQVTAKANNGDIYICMLVSKEQGSPLLSFADANMIGIIHEEQRRWR